MRRSGLALCDQLVFDRAGRRDGAASSMLAAAARPPTSRARMSKAPSWSGQRRGPALFTQAVVNRGAIGVVTTAPRLPYHRIKNPDILQWGSIPYDETRKPPSDFKRDGARGRGAESGGGRGRRAVRVGHRHVVRAQTRAHARRRKFPAPFAERAHRRRRARAGTRCERQRQWHGDEHGAGARAGDGYRCDAIRAARTHDHVSLVEEIARQPAWLTEHADQKAGVGYMFSMDMTGEDITKTGGTS